jgi:hypothetical protein
MVFTIFMVAFLGCSLDYLETARYRFTTDGLSVVLLGLLIHSMRIKWSEVRTAATRLP